MFYPDGPISVDYLKVEQETRRIARFLTRAEEAKVITRSGTDLVLSLKSREGREDNGINVKPGQWSNLPAGEAYIAPLEGTAEGDLVVEKGWYPDLKEDMVITFTKGAVSKIEGRGQVSAKLRQILGLEPGGKKREKRCNLAELGIGTNPKARRTDITIEAEKIKGTVHIGIGDNSHMGGTGRGGLPSGLRRAETGSLSGRSESHGRGGKMDRGKVMQCGFRIFRDVRGKGGDGDGRGLKSPRPMR